LKPSGKGVPALQVSVNGYNLTNDTWWNTGVSSGQESPGVAVVGNLIYISGSAGGTTQVQRRLRAYDPIANTLGPALAAQGVSENERMTSIAGHLVRLSKTDSFLYNPGTNTWVNIGLDGDRTDARITRAATEIFTFGGSGDFTLSRSMASFSIDPFAAPVGDYTPVQINAGRPAIPFDLNFTVTKHENATVRLQLRGGRYYSKPQLSAFRWA